MPELFNPTLPGQSFTTDAPGWGSAGWVTWDELDDKAKAAHQKALDAAKPKPAPHSLDLDVSSDTVPTPATGEPTTPEE